MGRSLSLLLDLMRGLRSSDELCYFLLGLVVVFFCPLPSMFFISFSWLINTLYTTTRGRTMFTLISSMQTSIAILTLKLRSGSTYCL